LRRGAAPPVTTCKQTGVWLSGRQAGALAVYAQSVAGRLLMVVDVVVVVVVHMRR